MPSSDASIAVASLAIAVTTIARRGLVPAELLHLAVDDPSCGMADAVISVLAKRGERDRARGLVDQLDAIRELGGWEATLAAAGPHVREAWEAAVWVAKGER